MSPAESDEIARGINAINAQRTSRAESAAEFLVAMVIAIIGALALLHWATPCDAGTLCAGGATLIPTRGETRLQMLLRPFRRWYLRVQLRAAEGDVAFHEETINLAPQLLDLAYSRAEELRVELALLER